ncbi:hypothetical protein [Paraburkholderia sp. RL17-337-BIB-A]|uniref:hypothetical protein n=1 Tax=Paraburkholderia sp. RL17-337-BIB-A TaxID=3031636 RepID=UPI0038B6BFA5
MKQSRQRYFYNRKPFYPGANVFDFSEKNCYRVQNCLTCKLRETQISHDALSANPWHEDELERDAARPRGRSHGELELKMDINNWNCFDNNFNGFKL